VVAATDTVTVSLWGTEVGAVTWVADRKLAVFQYMPDFLASGIQLSPLVMPLSSQPFSFPHLADSTFEGLPGLLSDALPDRFGNAVIDKWLESVGEDKTLHTVIDRLRLVGARGMGALEFSPSKQLAVSDNNQALNVSALVEFARQFFSRQTVGSAIAPGEIESGAEIFSKLVEVGTTAGGARAKAVVLFNAETGEVRPDHAELPAGFQHWLLKLDGVCSYSTDDPADESAHNLDQGLTEYAYSKMAIDAGIDMCACQLLQENDRHHFLTRRFDRTDAGEKLHMHSLCGLAHYDFNKPGAYSYEQAMEVVVKLGLDVSALEQLYRRALFNVLARNHDDHAKHIAFLMDSSGEWRLAPAFDLCFAFNPQGTYTRQHQMCLNGKQDGFSLADFHALADKFGLDATRASAMIEEVSDSVGLWPSYAAQVGVSMAQIEHIGLQHRLLT